MAASCGDGQNTRPSKGVSRILLKLESNLAERNFYEAHQIYKTLSYRLSNQKKYDEAIDLLYSGSCRLLQSQQIESGADLAMSLLDVIGKLDNDKRAGHIHKLTTIHELIPPDGQERQLFICKAIKQTKTSSHTAGSPELHGAVANTLWKEKRHSEARYHFLYSADGENCGRFLIELHHSSGSNPHEVDLFITQMVLQLLCLKNASTASVTFYAYVDNHPDVVKGPPYLLPLLNFLCFLLSAVNEGKLAVFTILCEKYNFSLSRDPLYKAYLDKIGQNFFGLPPPKNSGGLFSGLLNSLFSGLDESEDLPYSVSQDAPSTSGVSVQSPRILASSDLD